MRWKLWKGDDNIIGMTLVMEVMCKLVFSNVTIMLGFRDESQGYRVITKQMIAWNIYLCAYEDLNT